MSTPTGQTKTISLTSEEISRAIYEYMIRYHHKPALKIGYNIQNDMTDHAEPYSVGKLVGALVIVVDD